MYVLLCVIGNDKLFTDRFVIPMGEYDVILGMDWLSKYQATVDCFGQQITLVAKDGQGIEYSTKSGIVTPYPLDMHRGQEEFRVSGNDLCTRWRVGYYESLSC